MNITNKTKVTLYIEGERVVPDGTYEKMEMGFDTTNIHSKIGSCRIVTEYAERKFKNFGKIVAYETVIKDKQGLKNIVVREKNSKLKDCV